MMNTTIIGLGSNINPRKNIEKAVQRLTREYSIIKKTRLVKTAPVGLKDTSPFLNGALLIQTEETLPLLKRRLKALETALGRKKEQAKFAPRTIDLDILAWNGKVVDKDFYERDFIKKAVLELMPGIQY